MKGEVFNLLEEFISQNFGAETFEKIYEAVHKNLSTTEPFVGPGTYPDSDFFTILGSAVGELKLPLEQAAFEFGRFCFPRLNQKLSGRIQSFETIKDFLRNLHDVIHVEVKKLMRDAQPPQFIYQELSPKRIILIYRSKRKLYAFAEGLLHGAAQHYDTAIDVKRSEIDSELGTCKFEITFQENF
ncbi:MAG: heme NO-binding domain-containing protein [Bdellovibrionales bacterium]|nr:heme NO-binding domain-containing protein [Bdellovibrionales bacterium]